jgi:glutamate decarboxylase
MGINVQVCWEKFANYWDVEMRLVPMEGDRYHLSAEEAVAHCDENTIGVCRDPRLDLRRLIRAGGEICAALDAFERETGSTCRSTSTAPRARSSRRSSTPISCWDFRLPRVASINTSGHKYGLVYPGVGWIVWRDKDAYPRT